MAKGGHFSLHSQNVMVVLTIPSIKGSQAFLSLWPLDYTVGTEVEQGDKMLI